MLVAGAAAAGYLTRHTAKPGVARGLAAVRQEKGIGSAPGGSPSSVTCPLYKVGNSVRLTLEGTGTEAECEKFAQNLSGGGGYWVFGTPPLVEGLEEICAPTGPKGSTTAIVEDTGGAFYGTTICGNLSHRGWTADPNAPAEGPQEQAYNEAHPEEEHEPYLRERSNQNQSYLTCIQRATTPADLQNCAALRK